MAELSKNYDRIMKEIENTISNDEERKIVKQKVEELSEMFVDKMEMMSNIMEKDIKQLRNNEDKLNLIVRQLQKTVKEIETDIYEEDMSGEYDFEIVCPYCNAEFITDLSRMNEENDEIKCPECNNIIELDWNEDEENGCLGHCSGCHGCGGENEEIDEDDDM